MPRRIGYARVSTEDQHLDLQLDALKAAGCERIFADHGVSGSLRHRPELDRAIAMLEAGDQLVVWKLDRLGRSLSHLIDTLEGLSARGVHFESLMEKIDTKSIYGEFIFHIIGAMAQMERRIIRERTLAGLEAARRKGRKLGRRRSLSQAQIFDARQTHASRRETVNQIAVRMSVSEMTVRRAL